MTLGCFKLIIKANYKNLKYVLFMSGILSPFLHLLKIIVLSSSILGIVLLYIMILLNMMAQAFNPSTWEAYGKSL